MLLVWRKVNIVQILFKSVPVVIGIRCKQRLRAETEMKKYSLLFIPVFVIYVLIWSRNEGPAIQSKREEKIDEATLRQVPKQQHSPGVGEFTEETYESALVAGKRREKKGFMTIGIPTASRPNGSQYIQLTLDSLINNTDASERRNITIVVLLADRETASRQAINAQLFSKYRLHFQSGLLQTIEAPDSFYPTLYPTPPGYLEMTYNHSARRVKWRSKQNLDFAFLMTYGERLSDYYLQLEDDVITVPRYVTAIKRFMGKTPEWVCLEFSEIGFIGKFYRSQDVAKLAKFLTLFYSEQPNDVLYLHFNEINLQFKRLVSEPTIFQHEGIQSSLSGRRQEMVDINFQLWPRPSFPVHKRQRWRISGPERTEWEARIGRIQKAFCDIEL